MISFLRPVIVQAAVGVEAAEVAGVEPAVAHRRGRGVGPVVVAGHDDRAADEDLAVLASSSAVSGGEHLDLGAGQRLADRVDVRVARVVITSPRRSVSVRP